MIVSKSLPCRASRAPALCLALAVSLGGAGAVLAQGQDSSTSAQAPHTSAHPVPVLSTESVNAVPSGEIIQGIPMPAEMRPRSASPLVPAGPVGIAPVKLDCSVIADESARRTCSGRDGPGAPPHGPDTAGPASAPPQPAPAASPPP